MQAVVGIVARVTAGFGVAEFVAAGFVVMWTCCRALQSKLSHGGTQKIVAWMASSYE